jgi:hypothetical protein
VTTNEKKEKEIKIKKCKKIKKTSKFPGCMVAQNQRVLDTSLVVQISKLMKFNVCAAVYRSKEQSFCTYDTHNILVSLTP